MKDVSGYSTWETRKTYEYLTAKGFIPDPDRGLNVAISEVIQASDPYLKELRTLGLKEFQAYLQEPINYFEVLVRLIYDAAAP